MSNDGYEELSSTAPSGQTVHSCLPLLHPGRQIRVLVLDPVDSKSPSPDQRLHGHIDVLNQLAGHEYTALSYVWAPRAEAKYEPRIPPRENRLIIQCGDHQHQARIMPNCWSALWHLCKIHRPSTTRIWVDSICIDQNNEEEQNQQISIMCDIYKSAQKTYFWLGEAATGTDKAMDFLSRDIITSSTGGLGNTFLISIRVFWQLMKLRPYPHNEGLQNIFGREWIRRLWTLQEFLLSRDGIVVCGEKSVSWERFRCALESIDYLHNHPWSLFFDSSYLPWLNLAKLTEWLAENDGIPTCETSQVQVSNAHLKCLKWATRSVFILYWLNMPADVGLLLLGIYYFVLFYVFPQEHLRGKLFFPRTSHSILEELRNRDVSQPRDMYNGTIGILGGKPSGARESLYVVHRRLCASLICKTRSLDVLLFANTHADDNYSSWVIDWRFEIPNLWGKAMYYVDKRRSTKIRPSAEWNVESTTPRSGRVFWDWFGPLQEYLIRNFFFLKQEKLKQYRGAMPTTQLRWDFRDQGQSLRVYGFVLTHISSHITPRYAADKVEPLRPLRRVLLSIKTRVSLILAKLEALPFLQIPIIWCRLKTTESLFEMRGPRDAIPTSQVTQVQLERSQFISTLHAAFASMNKKGQKRAQKQLTALMIVATGDRRLERELRMWWRTLRAAAGILEGKEWLEEKVLTDEYVENSFKLVMHILQKAKLSAVGCEASGLLADFHGGLAFATAGAQAGDAVALISGMSYPLVLRPCGEGRFRLVGPIFLPGVMDGELENQVKRIALEEIIIV